MKNILIQLIFILFPNIVNATIDFQNTLFIVTESGASTSKLMTIDGKELTSFPKGSCKLNEFNTHAIVKTFGQEYLYDKNGEYLSFESMEFIYGYPYIIVSNSEQKYGIIDYKGNNILKLEYNGIETTWPYFTLKKGEFVGLFDIKLLKMVIPIKYDAFGGCGEYILTESGYLGVAKNGKYGLMDKSEKLITPIKYDWIGINMDCELSCWDYDRKEWISRNIAPIKINEKWGLLNTITGKEILPCIYDDINRKIYNPNLFFCKKNGKWGCINKNGIVIVPFEYDKFDTYYWNDYIVGDFFAIKQENNYKSICIYNSKGEIRLSGIEDYKRWRNDSDDNIYILKRSGRWYVYDIKSLSELYSFDGEIDEIVSRFVSTKYNGTKSIHDLKKKKKIGDFAYIDMYFSNPIGYAYCRNYQGRYGADIYDYIIDLNNGSTKKLPRNCCIDGSYDSYGNKIFSMWEWTNDGHNEGVIDVSGDIILPTIYKKHKDTNYSNLIEIVNNELILVKGVGIFNKEGKLLIEGNFSELTVKQNGVLQADSNPIIESDYSLIKAKLWSNVKKDYMVGYYKYNGEKITELLPCVYGDGEAYYQLCYNINKLNIPNVDKNVPYSEHSFSGNNIFAIIIANEDYTEGGISKVKYAKNDGKIFKEYCIKTLGIPAENIRYKENATLNNIRSQINWLKDITKVYNGNAKVIFYYTGHGIPDEQNYSSYLLPIDGIGNDTRSAYSLSELYSQLGELQSEQIIVFLDACFSGANKDGNMLVPSKGVAIKSKPGTPKGNTIVFSASQGDETAYQYNSMKHGMFTYYLLKKLQETKGDVTLFDLSKYITEQVQQCSIKENGKLQTPTVIPAQSVVNTWKTMQLR